MKTVSSRQTKTPKSRWPVRGTSLIEVLVAVLILSIGLLSMAAIHANALRETKTNQFKVSAAEIAAMLGDAVKANADAQVTTPTPNVLGGETVSTSGGYVIGTTGSDNTAPANLCQDPAAVACTPAQIAAVDLFRARAAAASLPLGDVMTTVANDTTTSPSLDIWVYWARPDANPNNTDTALNLTRESCPAAIQKLTPERQCIRHTVPL